MIVAQAAGDINIFMQMLGRVHRTGQVRLPKVSVFGKDQNFLWRDTPASWRTDAILAATQSALLPDSPAELREGWIRVAPEKAQGGGA